MQEVEAGTTSATAVKAATGKDEKQAGHIKVLRDKADAALAQGDPRLALATLEHGLSIDSRNATLMGGRSAAHLALEQPQEALIDACTAIALDSRWAKVPLPPNKKYLNFRPTERCDGDRDTGLFSPRQSVDGT